MSDIKHTNCSELAEYRQQIDAIDDQIIKLLVERTAVVSKVGAYKHKNGHTGCLIRPGREARMLRNISGRFADGDFPAAAAAAIWRIIIGASTSIESPLAIAAYTPEGNSDLYWLAREYFGAFIPVSKQSHTKRVIGEVIDDKSNIGILPALHSNDETLWWQNLLAKDAPKVFAHIPFVYPETPSRDTAGGLAIAKIAPEDTGNDLSLLVLEIDSNVSQSKLQASLSANQLQANWLHIATPNSSTRQHVLEISGFVPLDHSGLNSALSSLGGAVSNTYYLGSYAVPIILNAKKKP